MKKHEKYIEELKIGDLIAFRLYDFDAKMYSGKVTKIGITRLEVQTKNGQKHFVDKKNVQWINKGFWPKFVMNAFKGIDLVEEEEEKEEAKEQYFSLEEELEEEKEENEEKDSNWE